MEDTSSITVRSCSNCSGPHGLAECEVRTELHSVAEFEAWIARQDNRLRWRLVRTKGGFRLTHLLPQTPAVASVYLGAELSDKLLAVMPRSPSSRAGQALQPPQIWKLLHGPRGTECERPVRVGDVVRQGGRRYTVVKFDRILTLGKQLQALATTDGEPVYVHVPCACGGTPHGDERVLNLATKKVQRVCGYCRGLAPRSKKALA